MFDADPLDDHVCRGPDTNVSVFWSELIPEQNIAYIALYFAPFLRDSVWPLTTTVFYLIMWEFSSVLLSLQSNRLKLKTETRTRCFKAWTLPLNSCQMQSQHLYFFHRMFHLIQLYFFIEGIPQCAEQVYWWPPNATGVHASSGSRDLGRKQIRAKDCRGVFLEAGSTAEEQLQLRKSQRHGQTKREEMYPCSLAAGPVYSTMYQKDHCRSHGPIKDAIHNLRARQHTEVQL